MALGIGGSLQLSEGLSLQTDYVIHFNRNETSIYNNPFSVGLKFGKKSFSFEFIASTAQSYNEAGMISNGEGKWTKGNVYPGLNVIKIFN